MGDIGAALKLYQEELGVYEKLGAVRDRAIALIQLARLLAGTGEIDGALKMLREALDICETLGDAQGRAVCLTDIADIEWINGNWQRTITMYEEAITSMRALHDQVELSDMLTGLGEYLATLGEKKRRLKTCERRASWLKIWGRSRYSCRSNMYSI